ncbi:MAG: hypothetical protein IH968_09315 [Gemmatimonadetes bacterium]|nr:hypothetical protein [Gemmatimonadota bacterium]
MRVERFQLKKRMLKMLKGRTAYLDMSLMAPRRVTAWWKRIPMDAAHERAVNDDHDNRPDHA